MARKIILTIIIAFCSFSVHLISGNELPYFDKKADIYFEETTSEAAIAYATVRGVNAVVSVLKESQVEFSPAGIGISIAAGQILDPIDDMTERLSSVVVTALVSLGLQKLIMEIGGMVPLKCAAYILPLTIIVIWLPSGKFAITALILRACTLLLLLRLVLPFSALVNDTLYKELLQDRISTAEKQLSIISDKYHHFNNLEFDKSESFLPNFTRESKQKLKQTKELFKQISSNIDSIIGTLLELTVLYISLFFLQVIIVPIGMLWLMIFFVNTLFKSRIFPQMVDIRRIAIDKCEEKELIQKT